MKSSPEKEMNRRVQNQIEAAPIYVRGISVDARQRAAVRVARVLAQGYRAYHGGNLGERTELSAGSADYSGFHVGTIKAAEARIAEHVEDELDGPFYIYTVDLRSRHPYLPAGRILDEKYHADCVVLDGIADGRSLAGWHLLQAGFDIVPYVNRWEDRGFIVLDPALVGWILSGGICRTVATHEGREDFC
jgi:hypothetical protein